MNKEQPNNPLHGINLKQIVERLVGYYGWEQLGLIIEIGCFNYKPSVTSSLRFLRSTPWARTKVEKLYIAMQAEIEQNLCQTLEEPPASTIHPQKDGEPLEAKEDKADQKSVDQEQQILSDIESSSPSKPTTPPQKPYRGSKFEQAKPAAPKALPKFKFEYRKSKGSE